MATEMPGQETAQLLAVPDSRWLLEDAELSDYALVIVSDESREETSSELAEERAAKKQKLQNGDTADGVLAEMPVHGSVLGTHSAYFKQQIRSWSTAAGTSTGGKRRLTVIIEADELEATQKARRDSAPFMHRIAFFSAI